jgi:hypothetical protein
MAANLPYFLLPTRSVTFIYDGTYWTQMSASNAGGFDTFEDFTGVTSVTAASGTAGVMGISSIGSAAGVRSNATAGGVDDNWGAMFVSTGTTTTGYATCSMLARRTGGNNAFGAAATNNSVPYLTVGKVSLDFTATALQDYQAYFGMNGKSSLPEVPTSSSGGFNWLYKGFTSGGVWNVFSINNAGTSTDIATSITASVGSAIWLGVYKPGGSTIRDAVYFYSTNGIVYQPAYKFVGTTGSYGGAPTIGVTSTAGITAKTFTADWIGGSFNLSR